MLVLQINVPIYALLEVCVVFNFFFSYFWKNDTTTVFASSNIFFDHFVYEKQINCIIYTGFLCEKHFSLRH